MGMSNYPNGFRDGMTSRNVPRHDVHPGHVYWVGNNASLETNEKAASDANNKGGYLEPYSSIDYAIGQCKANRGDVIYVRPNHSITITAADAIDIDVAGVDIIGLGSGSNTPIIKYNNTAATVAIDAANVHIHNIHFQSLITVVAKGLDIKDGADDFVVSNCRFTSETVGTDEFEDCLYVKTADRGIIEDCYFDMDDQADADSAIHYFGICLGGTIRRNTILGDYTIACIESEDAAQEQLIIEDNILVNGSHSGLGTVACISLLTATSGFIHNNQLYTNVSTPITAAIAADACFLGSNPLTTTAESSHAFAEGGLNGAIIVKSAVKTGVADEAIDDLFTIVGTVDIYGIVAVVTTASGSDQTIGCFFDSDVASQADITIHALANHDLDLLGDTMSGTASGTVWIETVSPGDTTPIWSSPLRVQAGVVESLVGGVAGALVTSWTIYYSLVSEDATLTVA